MPRRGAERPSGRSGKRQSQGHTRARAEAPRVATKGQSRGAQREGIAAQFAERREAEPRTHPRAEAPRVATKGQSRGAQRKCRAKARGRAAQLHAVQVTVERRRGRGSAAPAMPGRTDPRPSVEFEGATDERSTSTLREGGGTSPSAKETGARPADKGAQVKEVCGASVAWAHRLCG